MSSKYDGRFPEPPYPTQADLDNTDELIEAMKEGFAVRLADVEATCETHKARIAELRQALIRLACYAAMAKSGNSLKWMDGLVSQLNSIAITVNEPKRFVLHKSSDNGAMWITIRDIP